MITNVRYSVLLLFFAQRHKVYEIGRNFVLCTLSNVLYDLERLAILKKKINGYIFDLSVSGCVYLIVTYNTLYVDSCRLVTNAIKIVWVIREYIFALRY